MDYSNLDPTHLLSNSSSCFDLTFTNQPNLAVNSVVRSSVHVKCHHQIIHCQFNLMIVHPPPNECLVWDYKRANTDVIINSIIQVDWEFLFFPIRMFTVNIFNITSINVSSNFIPNKYAIFNDKDPPWMTNYLKYKIHRKNSFYLKYLKHGKKNCDYIELQRSIEEVSEGKSKCKEQHYACLAKS